MERGRPDPDELLERVEAADRRSRRGRLKIFLGYAAGVGKTYAMLQAAHERRAEGVDVVVALVETHGRVETERLLEGLEVLPRRREEYRGATFADLDLDGTLERAPRIALVDELAHSNVPGARHLKRYQDVEELLDTGIDVYTTLNVQHLESYNDVVAQVTGIVMRETVPDRVLEESAEIELVDLPPDDLLQRLREGKVYIPEQATRAAGRFFRPGNLSALREMALRRAAQQVDAEMLAYMQTQAIPGPWAAGERLLVSVGPSPTSERLVRTAKRLADEIKAEWLALCVETPDMADRPDARERAHRNLALAERLGARVITLPGRSVEETLVDYARRHNVTKIVAGKPLIPRWRELLRGSLMDRIIRLSGDIDVYVISSTEKDAAAPPAAARPPFRWRPYLLAIPPVIIATLVGFPLSRLVEPANVVMLYLAAVILVGVYLGRGPAVLAATLSVLAFDFFLVPPHYTFAVSDTQYVLTFAGLFIVGLVVSSLAARAREQAKAAQQRELQTSELYELSRELAGAAGIEAITAVIRSHVHQFLGGHVVVLLRSERGLQPAPGSGDPDDPERAVATWVLDHGRPAGRGTDTLPGARLLYLPLRSTSRGVIGVLGVEIGEPADPLHATERRAPEAFATLAALAYERAELAVAANEVELMRATEDLHSALLNSISHELRTPLASIAGVLSSLRGKTHGGPRAGPRLPEASRDELIETAWEEADRLNRMVGTLLDMTRLESGALRVVAEPADVEDLVGATLAQLEDRLVDRPVRIELPPDLPPVSADAVLIVHALANVLDNALKYSSAGSSIEIGARTGNEEVLLTVADHGPGIPPRELETVFEKFRRLESADQAGTVVPPSGLGLGLSISRGIVRAHQGRIWVENRPGGGTRVTLALPTIGAAAPDPKKPAPPKPETAL